LAKKIQVGTSGHARIFQPPSSYLAIQTLGNSGYKHSPFQSIDGHVLS